MVQPAHCLSSTSALQCCLLFLLASWEAGATILQEHQKTGGFSTSDPLFLLTPRHVYSTPRAHTAFDSAHSPPGPSKSTEIHKAKHRCTTTHHPKPVQKAIETHTNATTLHEVSSTSEQNLRNQGKDPVVRNERSINNTSSTKNHKESSDAKHITPTPNRKTTCHKTTRANSTITRNSAKTLEKTITTLNNKSITSYKTTIPLPKSVNSETNKRLTSSSENTKVSQDKITTVPEKTTTVAGESYKVTKTKGHSTTIEDHITAANHRTKFVSEKTSGSPVKLTEYTERTALTPEKTTRATTKTKEHPNKTISAHEKTTKTPVRTTEYLKKMTWIPDKSTRIPVKTNKWSKKNTSAPVTTSKIPVKSPEHIEKDAPMTTTRFPVGTLEQSEKTTSVPYKKSTRVSVKTLEPKKTTLAPEKTIKVPEKTTKQMKTTTWTTEKTKRVPAKHPEHPEKITVATESTRHPFTITGDISLTTTSHSNKNEVTHQVPIESFTLTTSSLELSSKISEAPGNKSHPYQNKGGSKGSLHAGETGENDSFPAWAIVLVVLVAVILLLVFFSLIFLVSCLTRTRHPLTQKSQENDPEDDGGPNSYPVYLMEQQTLGKGQIPSSR